MLCVNYSLSCAEIINEWNTVALAIERCNGFRYIELCLRSCFKLVAYGSDVSKGGLNVAKKVTKTHLYFFKSRVPRLKNEKKPIPFYLEMKLMEAIWAGKKLTVGAIPSVVFKSIPILEDFLATECMFNRENL